MIEIQVVPEQPKALEVEAEGWWNDDHDVYTWPVRVGKWGAKIECHGSTPMEAQALALHVVTAIGAIGNATPAPETEPPTTVGALILGGAVSSTELGDNDVTLDSQVVERLQRELVKDSEDIAVELMLVGQHYRILQALRAERDVALAAVAQLHSMLGVTDQVQAGERLGFLVGQSIMAPKLEAKLADLEKQEPIGWWAQYCETPMRRMVHWGEKLPECATDTFHPFYAAPVAQAGQVPSVCDGKEQNAFEAWAAGQKMDMSCHPLHWLFLNDKTYSARQGWKAALEYVGSQIAAAPAQGGE